jgi:hypothetical protein
MRSIRSAFATGLSARRSVMVAIVAGLNACVSPPLDTPPPSREAVIQWWMPQNVKEKVDILFMVDNSASMGAMQDELKSKFEQFFKPFASLAARSQNPGFADLNIGVVTSDFGAGASGALGCTPSGPQGGGDRGRLQGKGRQAASDCLSPVGTRFVHYAYSADGSGRNNLPPGQDLLKTFTCMASVGSAGCGFEHQLESVYAALHDDIPENRGTALDPGFLREDALLVVVFLTNEDDASAPPDSDVFDKNLTARYGYQDSYSRQTRFAVECGVPPAPPPYGDSGGPLPSCIPAPNLPTGAGPGKQYDVSRYVNFFTSPAIAGGVKTDPLDVLLVGIDAPEDPFEVILADPGTPPGRPYRSCPRLDEQSNPPCVPVLVHSCVGESADFFGDPAVRLNTVIRAAAKNQITSICASDYTPALDAVARQIVSSIGGGCITAPLPRDPVTGQPVIHCAVLDETLLDSGERVDHSLPACDAAHSVVPCWVIEHKDACGPPATGEPPLSPDAVGLTVDRGRSGSGVDNLAPPHTTAVVSCATQAP